MEQWHGYLWFYPFDEGSLNNNLGDLGSSVGKVMNLHLRIIQTLNNPKLSFHLKNIRAEVLQMFLKKIQFSEGVAFYFSSSVWITHSKSRGARWHYCLKQLRRGCGQLENAVSEQADGRSSCWWLVAAIGVTVARFSTYQEKQQLLTFLSHRLIFKCWQIIQNILNALWTK